MTWDPRRRRLLLIALLSLVTLHYGGALAASDAATSVEVQSGEYLAIVGDCEACHTAPGEAPFSGGLPVATPIGAIYSTNITPSKSSGIGNYTRQQFSDALRKGIRADGKRLYPAMPYTAYAEITDNDLEALYAYFMTRVPPVDNSGPHTHLPFPFNIRASMALWNLLFLEKTPFAPEPDKGSQWNRGAYLVRGLTHCGTCHTPRNWLMAEEPSHGLSGASLGTWFAPNITSDEDSGLGTWTVRDIVDYLQRGDAIGKAQAGGPMAEAIDHSLRHLTKADLTAAAVYLKTVPAQHARADTRPADSWGKPYANLPDLRGRGLPEDPDRMTGAQLYDAYCATCHLDRGQGSFDGGLPPLFHNTATGHRNADNLVMVMLGGIAWSTDGSGVRMPGFAPELSDRQIATLGRYVTEHFGNPAATVTTDQVRRLRAGGGTSHLVMLARIALLVVLVTVAVLLGALFRRRGRWIPR